MLCTQLVFYIKNKSAIKLDNLLSYIQIKPRQTIQTKPVSQYILSQQYTVTLPHCYCNSDGDFVIIIRCCKVYIMCCWNVDQKPNSR